jgi:ribonuclease HII
VAALLKNRWSLMLSLSEETAVRTLGYKYIAGIDEVGRGPLAGPVLAASIIMPEKIKRENWAQRVKDSKMLTAKSREDLYDFIMEKAIGFGIGIVDSTIIDNINIYQATKLAMKQAVDNCAPYPDYLLIDYVKLPEVKIPQKGVKEGDSVCFSIACASIIAKVTRDRMMVDLDLQYPGYGFAIHKGYGTRRHLECLNRLGPCPIHRRSFQPVRESIPGYTPPPRAEKLIL